MKKLLHNYCGGTNKELSTYSSHFLKRALKKRVILILMLFSTFSMQLSAQTFQVTGTVTDIKGEVIPGASVKLKNGTVGTVSDVNGKYTIAVPDAGVLVFTYLGFITKELPVARGRSVMNVQMESELTSLEEVVVVGYGTLDKKEVTSAISHVSADDLSSAASNDPLMRLQGKVPGLNIQNTNGADPNANASIQLRGVSTRSGSTSPLVVIDGVSGGNLSNVNENDIASIDILKDGAASAIYGTRASNGVILITTKKGQAGAGKTTYNTYGSFDVPTMVLRPLSAQQWRDYKRGDDMGASTDWLDAVSNPYKFAQKHTLSFTGGGGTTAYRATIDYLNSNGLDLRAGREQYGGRVSINHTGGNGRYNIILNAAPRYTTTSSSNNAAFDQALLLNPTEHIFEPSDPSGKAYRSQGGFGQNNPVEILKLQQAGQEQKSLDMNATFKLNILPALSTQLQLAQIASDGFNFSFSPSTMTTQISSATKGTASRTYSKDDQYSLEWQANYAFNVKKHSVKLLGVYSYQYFVGSDLSADNRDFPSDALSYNSLSSGTYQNVAGRSGLSTSKDDSRLISFRTRLNYSFNDKYMLSASVTRDGSSRFGQNNKWAYFPGVSVGWRISEEPFMQGLSWISDIKVRGDYGETGNQSAISNYQSLARYSAGNRQYMYNGSYVQVWGPANNVNPDLRWEKLKNWNIGLDFDLFNNKIGGTINYYNRKAVDLLGSYNAPPYANIQSSTTANVGTMSSSGLEVELNGEVINKKNFSYDVSVNGSTQNAVFGTFSNAVYKGQTFVTQLSMPAPGTPGPIMRMEEGRRLGSYYMWEHAGVDANGNFLVYNAKHEPILGSLATEVDKKYVGNGQAKFVGGMSHNLKYKNWDAAASMRGMFGYEIFNVHNFYYGLKSAAANANVLEKAYTTNGAISGEKLNTSFFLENGNFVKLDVITLGYTLVSKWKYFDTMRIYGSTRNLATFTKFTGVDPDTYPVNGLTPGATSSKNYTPTTTQYLIGLQFNF